METEKEVKTKQKTSLKQSFWEFTKFFVIAALIVVPIRMWIAQPFIVSGASMSPNFKNGDYLIIDEFSYHFREPQRGEVIVFRYPFEPSKFFIKRIIGLPNEKIEIKNNEIYIYNEEFPQGVLINESYLSKKLETAQLAVTLQDDEYYVLGDNRTQSSDSRIWGSLSKNLIIGRTWIRLWPFNKAFISF